MVSLLVTFFVVLPPICNLTYLENTDTLPQFVPSSAKRPLASS